MTEENNEDRLLTLKKYAKWMADIAFPFPDDTQGRTDEANDITGLAELGKALFEWFEDKERNTAPIKRFLAEDAFQPERQAKAGELKKKDLLPGMQDDDPIRRLAREAGIIEPEDPPPQPEP